MIKFNEDAIKKDVEETLALLQRCGSAVKKICEKGYNNIFLRRYWRYICSCRRINVLS